MEDAMGIRERISNFPLLSRVVRRFKDVSEGNGLNRQITMRGERTEFTPDQKPLLVSSPEEIALLSKQITLRLSLPPLQDNLTPETLTLALENLLQSIYDRPSPEILAFVDRRESFVPPILDIYVLWSSPIQLSYHSSEMEDLLAEHAKFLHHIKPFLNSFLKIVDPRRYPTPEHLKDYLSNKHHPAASTRILGFVQLQRS